MICTLASPEIEKSIADLQRAEERIGLARQHLHWREWVAARKEAVPQLLAGAALVETSWFKIAQDNQDALVNARNLLAEWIQSQPKPKNIVEQISRIYMSLWIASQEHDLVQFGYALTRFMIAVDRAVSSEARHLARADVCLEHNDEIQEVMRRGEADAKSGRGHSYTVEEFRERFSFG
ncbi:MAG TPA: hypothetical protein VMS32_07530 [Verrucomicrobiae bacterium]|jgi:hypothetical protein|nr:hypothetical protein [Verrucomicrobiae bacterium]